MSKKRRVITSQDELIVLPRRIESSLHELRLCDNAIVTIPPMISSLTYLKILDLSNNHIKEIPDCISNLVSLERLYMQNNRLESISSQLVTLTHLWEVSLFGNPALPRMLSVSVVGTEGVERLFRILYRYHQLLHQMCSVNLPRDLVEMLFNKLTRES